MNNGPHTSMASWGHAQGALSPSRFSVIPGGRSRALGSERRHDNEVVDRLYYVAPEAIPDFCATCGADIETVLHPWGPSWSCARTGCTQHTQPTLVSLVDLELLLRISEDWSCPCCGGTLSMRLDQFELLPSCPQGESIDWTAIGESTVTAA